MAAYDFLRSVPLFAELPEEDLKRLCEIVDVVTLKAGDILFKEGEAGESAFVIHTGDLEVVKQSAGREVLLAVRKPGEVVGEVALLEEAPRMATVRARGEAELYAIGKQQLNDLVANSTSAARAMFYTVLARWRATESMLRQSEKMAQLGTLSAGVAHELNNPAAAVRRGAEQLGDELDRHGAALSGLATHPLTPEGRQIVDLHLARARTKAAAGAALDAVTRSDREQALEDWLTAHAVPEPWTLSPVLVDAGLEPGELDRLAAATGPAALPHALRLVASTRAVQSLLHEVGEGAGRISDIVKALKSYAYLDQAPVQEVDVHEGLESTLVILRNKLKQGVEVRKDYAKDLPRITAYGSELNQVWTNIIDNAIDAMSGKGTLTIRTRQDGGSIVVEIEDSGTGIPAHILPRIFDPFFTTKPPGMGTGLGLDISYRIVVQRHRGEIKAFSQPGRTVFQVILPIRPDAPAAGSMAAPPQAGAATGTERDEELRRILRDTKTIAVVGISGDPAKPANNVPAYLQSQGYRILPVNPTLTIVLGVSAVGSLKDLQEQVDLVQIFRRPEVVPAVVDEALAMTHRPKVIWMQPGVVNEQAAERARHAGVLVVMDTCMMATHRRLIGEQAAAGGSKGSAGSAE